MTNATQGRAIGATISSLLLLSLWLGQRQLCLASAPEATPDNSIRLHLNQHQHHNQQPQHLKTAGGEQLLLGQLLRLAAPTTGEQAVDRRDLDSLLAGGLAKKQQQQFVMKAAKQTDEKAALKRKLHKYVDELVDSGAGTGFGPERKFAVSVPMAHTRPREAMTQQQQQQQLETSEADDKPLPLNLVKRKPQLVDLDGSSGSPVLNSLGDLQAPQGAAAGQQQQQRHPGNVNMVEHQRRIQDDKFGILRHSIFSTNNQLGTKEVPKFGSDEQF